MSAHLLSSQSLRDSRFAVRGACLVLSVSTKNDRMKGLGNATSTILVVASLRVYKVKRQTFLSLWAQVGSVSAEGMWMCEPPLCNIKKMCSVWSLGDVVFPQGTVSRNRCSVFLYLSLLSPSLLLHPLPLPSLFLLLSPSSSFHQIFPECLQGTSHPARLVRCNSE